MSYQPIFDKYTPTSFSECYPSIVNENLEKLKDLPNIIVYGPAGNGKFTRLLICLKIFFEGLCNPFHSFPRAIDVETGEFLPVTTTKKSIFAVVSKCHCEIDLEQSSVNKALLPFLDYYTKSKNISFDCHKYIILRNLSFLKKETQNALRKVIEDTHKTTRFLCTTYSISDVINPLRSRFFCLKLESPSVDNALHIINTISDNEGWKLTKKKKEAIIEKSRYGSAGTINLRELLLTLEGTILTSKLYTSERNEVSDLLIKAVKKGQRKKIRDILYKTYEFMKNDFRNIVMLDFYRKLLPEIDKKMEFLQLTQKYDHRISQSFIRQEILHAEAYLFAVCDLLNY
jgi:DNA polymerase III delta prime subunit